MANSKPVTKNSQAQNQGVDRAKNTQIEYSRKYYKRSIILGIIALIIFVIGLVGIVAKDLLGFVFSFDGFISWVYVIWIVLSILIFVLLLLSLYAYFKPGLRIPRDISLIFLTYLIITLVLVGNIFFGNLGNDDNQSDMGDGAGDVIEDLNPDNSDNAVIEDRETKLVCDFPAFIVRPGVELIQDFTLDEPKKYWSRHMLFTKGEGDINQIDMSEKGLVTIKTGEGTTNSRAGLMQGLNIDTTNAKHMILRAKIKVNESNSPSNPTTLEAPLSIGLIYYDKDCVVRSLVVENNNIKTADLLWTGFNYVEGTSSNTSELVIVKKGEWYEYSYDLASLNAKIIRSVGFEGAGQAPRSATVDFVSLQIIKLK